MELFNILDIIAFPFWILSIVATISIAEKSYSHDQIDFLLFHMLGYHIFTIKSILQLMHSINSDNTSLYLTISFSFLNTIVSAAYVLVLIVDLTFFYRISTYSQSWAIFTWIVSLVTFGSLVYSSESWEKQIFKGIFIYNVLDVLICFALVIKYLQIGYAIEKGSINIRFLEFLIEFVASGFWIGSTVSVSADDVEYAMQNFSKIGISVASLGFGIFLLIQKIKAKKMKNFRINSLIKESFNNHLEKSKEGNDSDMEFKLASYYGIDEAICIKNNHLGVSKTLPEVDLNEKSIDVILDDYPKSEEFGEKINKFINQGMANLRIESTRPEMLNREYITLEEYKRV